MNSNNNVVLVPLEEPVIASSIVPAMIKNPDPRARAKVSSTQPFVQVRAFPKFDARVITNVQKNKSYPVIGCTKDNQWWQLLADGVPGWVSATSLKVRNTQAVANTYIGEGGLPAAQEVYFMYALGQHRDRLKQLPALTKFNHLFLQETQWADVQRVMIPASDLDPEYLTPAEGAVGMMERALRAKDPGYQRNAFLTCIVYFGSMVLLFALSGSVSLAPVGILAGIVAFFAPVIFLIYRARTARNFSHNRYFTKSQQSEAQMRNNATTAAAVGATLAAGALLYSAQRGKKTGQPLDLAKGLGNAVKLASVAAPAIGKAAPAIGTVAAVALANKVASGVKENQLVTSQVVPILRHHTFISYRRSDAAGFAYRLYEELTKTFAEGGVFLDTEEIPVGVDFRSILLDRLSNCKVVIIVMGPTWLDEMKRRAANPQQFDFVKEEIAEALRRKLCIIPLRLTDGQTIAPWPTEDDLPAEIALLAYRNAMTINIHQLNTTELVTRINEELAKHILLSGGVEKSV